MKNLLTKNIGLKLLSIIVSFFLWLVVVNVDDPIISRTYTGISVELLNADKVSLSGKCYEVLDNTDTISVVVTAKRSVIDEMSKDYIKATADFNAMTQLDTVPIEVRSIRYADKIESVTTRTEYLKLELENISEKNVPVVVVYEGQVKSGYVLAGIENDTASILVTGPESVVAKVAKMEAQVDISGISEDVAISQQVVPCDENGNVVEDSRLVIRNLVADIKFIVNAVKEIPITSGYSGTPLNGYVATGTVITNPSSVYIAGRGENYDDMNVIYISPDAISIEGAMADIEGVVDISDYLPTGVSFVDPDFDPQVEVVVDIEATQKKVITVPTSNITMENVPEAYVANIVDIGGTIDVEIQGLGDTFDRYSGDLAIGVIDAANLVPRTMPEQPDAAPLTVGENDGIVTFDFPNGISVTSPVSMMVIVDYIGDINGKAENNSAIDTTSSDSDVSDTSKQAE